MAHRIRSIQGSCSTPSSGHSGDLFSMPASRAAPPPPGLPSPRVRAAASSGAVRTSPHMRRPLPRRPPPPPPRFNALQQQPEDPFADNYVLRLAMPSVPSMEMLRQQAREERDRRAHLIANLLLSRKRARPMRRRPVDPESDRPERPYVRSSLSVPVH
ncbi:hypothetical protein PUNSTDRAFT_53372 [Punctularia strigosozonata HHB-11173 SS5]|uniref:uncharacterized protein n=1 Tax=Punctularia strigosozonata (strain HHB-11173) TaxID=741275 RepID=UPI0004416C86|nr:uncharacterized protein PUNSTDRAFT_53372 [Punctularia strigosozonata HHB-11173 SS5]EIN08110.1 hypothetical protein PUNSTDRAFT_53372 [Punctularia strigosozonata HHB-11173 SS5]